MFLHREGNHLVDQNGGVYHRDRQSTLRNFNNRRHHPDCAGYCLCTSLCLSPLRLHSRATNINRNFVLEEYKEVLKSTVLRPHPHLNLRTEVYFWLANFPPRPCSLRTIFPVPAVWFTASIYAVIHYSITQSLMRHCGRLNR